MMKRVDVLILSGASITASPWFTWADILIELLSPTHVINVSSRGTGNQWISLSLINSIMDLNRKENVLCAAMFTNIDKFDMFLSKTKTDHYLQQKHPPIDLNGKPVRSGPSFWCTGSHWPDDKKIYLQNFFDLTMATINTISAFNNLAYVCNQQKTDLLPLFDSHIWNILEKDLNEFVKGAALPDRRLSEDPLVSKFAATLDKKFMEFVPLINWAIDNNLPFYNETNKMHPPSYVHLKWVLENVIPDLRERYICHELRPMFINMIERLSKEWQ
jgi:hypothetical protein